MSGGKLTGSMPVDVPLDAPVKRVSEDEVSVFGKYRTNHPPYSDSLVPRNPR